MRARVFGALGIAVMAILCLMLTSAVAVLALRSPDVKTLQTTTASRLAADYAADGRTTAPLDNDLIDAARDDEAATSSTGTARRVEVVQVTGGDTDDEPDAGATGTVDDDNGGGDPEDEATPARTPTRPAHDGTPGADSTTEPTPPAGGSPTPAASTPTQVPMPSATAETSPTAIASPTERALPSPTRERNDDDDRTTPTIEPTEEVKTPGTAPSATATRTPTATKTPTSVPPATPVPVFTNTPTPTHTSTPAPSETPTFTHTPTPTPSPTRTATSTATPTPTPTTPATATPSPTPTSTLQAGTLWVDPASQTVAAGSVFADIRITGATNLGEYEFSLDWDPAILDFVGVTNGPFLGSSGNTVTCSPVTTSSGTLTFGCNTLLSLLGPDGDGVLATVEFATADDGVTDLDLHDSVLTTLLLVQQPSTEVDGTVTVGTPVTETYDAMSIDTYVDQDAPTSSFGNDSEVILEGETGKVTRALVDFNWSLGLMDKKILAAEITMCIVNTTGGSTGRTHDLRRVSSSWDGSTTWNTQPSVYAAVSDSAVVPGDDVCLTFDVTDDMQAMADGSPCFGWRLGHATEGQASGSDTRYAASEYGTPSLRPTLKVTYLP